MKPSEQNLTLKLELFVADLAASIDFYQRVLGFELSQQKADGYTLMTHGATPLALNLRSHLPDDHPVQLIPPERPGRGVEIVLEVDDVADFYNHVRAQNWPLSNALTRQPWGTTDFRILDPDGYYLRITSRP